MLTSRSGSARPAPKGVVATGSKGRTSALDSYRGVWDLE